MTEDLSNKAAKIKAIRRHCIRHEIEESEENSGEDTEETEYSSSGSEDEDSDQEIDNDAYEDVVLAVISDEWEEPTTTRSGRTVTRRSATDFVFF